MDEGLRNFSTAHAVTDLLRFISIANQLRPLLSRDGKVLQFETASMKLNTFILTQLRAAASPREGIAIGVTSGIKNVKR